MLCASAGWSARAPAQSESALRDRIERSRAHERELSGAVARLDALIARTGREIAIVQGRLDESRRSSSRRRRGWRRRAPNCARRGSACCGCARRLADGRATLAAQLVASYKSDPPDIVSLVLGADSFADLLEQVEFIKRVSAHNAGVVDGCGSRAPRRSTRRRCSRGWSCGAATRPPTSAGARDALASMRDGMAQRQATLVRARAARAHALAGTRSGRRSAQRSLSRLIAERERAAAAAAAGPGGPWAIPWPIVQCESGGQNLPPNSAGASGYYQMLPSTWKGLGGSTRQAYQASKAEQDRLAARLWAGGAGARNWVCAELV